MNKFKCPDCKIKLNTIADPDFEYEKCPACKGIFLDKDELNILSTGLAGNIEFCSVDYEKHEDDKPVRFCPKCNKEMSKVNLLSFSSVIFDYCKNCQGFFLDSDESGKMNDYLDYIANNSPYEFRDRIDDVLVRGDINGGIRLAVNVSVPGTEAFQEENYLFISAYFNRPAEFEFNITQETLVYKFLKLFMRNTDRDLQTGNEKFDAIFKVCK